MRVLISRFGAYGDMVIVTPLVRHLAAHGHEVYLLTSDQGLQVFQHNPHVTRFIAHPKDVIPSSQLGDYLEAVRQGYECDRHVGLSESIEVNLALHPNSPRFKWPKHQKLATCNRNYYEETFAWAERELGEPFEPSYRPEMHFTDEERGLMRAAFQTIPNRMVLLWGLSGSSRNKVYPYVHEVLRDLVETFPELIVITVGDAMCQVLELPFRNKPFRGRVICRSGAWSFRQSALACEFADLVVSPDTGLLHAAGCTDTPKVGLLNHTTHENICKHFTNDRCLEATGPGCRPCFQIHYSAVDTCNLEQAGTFASNALCMTRGLPASLVRDRIAEELRCQKVRRVSL